MLTPQSREGWDGRGCPGLGTAWSQCPGGATVGVPCPCALAGWDVALVPCLRLPSSSCSPSWGGWSSAGSGRGRGLFRAGTPSSLLGSNDLVGLILLGVEGARIRCDARAVTESSSHTWSDLRLLLPLTGERPVGGLCALLDDALLLLEVSSRRLSIWSSFLSRLLALSCLADGLLRDTDLGSEGARRCGGLRAVT